MQDTVSQSMSWREYAHYIEENTNLTQNQSYAVAGNFYPVDLQTVSEELGTTENTLNVQLSRLKREDVEEKRQPEFFSNPVPGVPFRLMGEIEYFYSEVWPEESNYGEVYIYFATTEEDDYAAVIEKQSVANKTDLSEPDKNGVLAQIEDIEKTTIYEDIESFLSNSMHSPENVTRQEMEIEAYGRLYSGTE
jgi:hypothetical protein